MRDEQEEEEVRREYRSGDISVVDTRCILELPTHGTKNVKRRKEI
jgi:hypothetical protein